MENILKSLKKDREIFLRLAQGEGAVADWAAGKLILTQNKIDRLKETA